MVNKDLQKIVSILQRLKTELNMFQSAQASFGKKHLKNEEL